MIKKFNKLMDDIPLIFKLILGVIMCAILTLMGLILFFFFLPEVNAQAVNPDSNQIYAEALNGDNPEYITIGQNQEYSLSVLKRSNLFVSNFINLGTGVYKGTAYVKFFNTKDETCSQLRQATNRVVLSLNDIEVQGTKNITACTISDNYATLKIEYSYTNMTTNGVFKLIYRLPMWNIDTKYLMRSTLDYEAKDYATNTDIENQTISIINNAIQNAQDIINNSIQENILNRNAISSAVDNAATSIINNAYDLSKNCKNREYKNEIFDEKGRIQANGTIATSTTYYYTSDYIEINKNTTYHLSINYNGNTAHYCLYDEDKNIINCVNYSSNREIDINSGNAVYIRYTGFIGNYAPELSPNITIFSGKYCQSNTQAEIDAIENMNITLSTKLQEAFDMEEENAEEQKGLLQSIISGITGLFNFFDDDDYDDPDNALSSLNSNMGTNNVISSLLLLPVTLYQSVVNNINGTCNSFNLGSLYNHNLTMTCIQPENYIGSTLWGVIDVIISGLFVLHIRKRFVDIFNHLTSLRTGGNELE